MKRKATLLRFFLRARPFLSLPLFYAARPSLSLSLSPLLLETILNGFWRGNTSEQLPDCVNYAIYLTRQCRLGKAFSLFSSRGCVEVSCLAGDELTQTDEESRLLKALGLSLMKNSDKCRADYASH